MSYYSQFGQDYWLIHEVFKGRVSGYFVDVGAFQMANGYMSNTFALERHFAWRGLLIEPNPALCGPLRSRESLLINAVISDAARPLRFRYGDRGCNSMVLESEGDEVMAEPLAAVLMREKAPSQMDLLSIDVEGHELEVLLGIDFDRFQFRCIIVETNGKREAIISLLESKGYRFIEEHRVDLYFSAMDLISAPPSEVLANWEAQPERVFAVHTPLLKTIRRN